MKTQQPISVTAAGSRFGRALLHILCLCRGGECRWHGRGIVRELFSRPDRAIRRVNQFRWRLPAAVMSAIFQTSMIAWAAPVSLEVRNDVVVDSSGTFLHQVVATVPESFAKQPVRLADAPAFGRAFYYTPEKIEVLLRRVYPNLPAVTWTGASQARVLRRGKFLTEGELRELLAATLQSEQVRDRGALEIGFGRPWSNVNLPDEPLTLRVLNLPASGVSPNFIVRFEIVAGTERFGPWQMVVQARVMKDVPIARTALKRGQPLTISDFSTERRDVLSLREPVDIDMLNNPTLELNENVSPGQPLLARSIRMRPVVLRGQVVDGLVRDGAMKISLKVEVLGEGLPGQTIRVRNPKNKREYYAKIQDEQTVVIDL